MIFCDPSDYLQRTLKAIGCTAPQIPAFLDALQITDGRGNLTFRKPIAQFDLIDGIGGLSSGFAINGVSLYMGDDRVSPGEGTNGLAHAFVDSTVTNGVTYYYAVTAYDYGAASANISPTETPVTNSDASQTGRLRRGAMLLWQLLWRL